jgi:hypothetical protein
MGASACLCNDGETKAPLRLRETAKIRQIKVHPRSIVLVLVLVITGKGRELCCIDVVFFFSFCLRLPVSSFVVPSHQLSAFSLSSSSTSLLMGTVRCLSLFVPSTSKVQSEYVQVRC